MHICTLPVTAITAWLTGHRAILQSSLEKTNAKKENKHYGRSTVMGKHGSGYQYGDVEQQRNGQVCFFPETSTSKSMYYFGSQPQESDEIHCSFPSQTPDLVPVLFPVYLCHFCSNLKLPGSHKG